VCGKLNHTTKLLVYQVGASGDTQKKAKERRVTGWRLLEVSAITRCVALEEMLAGSRGGSYARHLAWEVVYSRVASS